MYVLHVCVPAAGRMFSENATAEKNPVNSDFWGRVNMLDVIKVRALNSSDVRRKGRSTEHMVITILKNNVKMLKNPTNSPIKHLSVSFSYCLNWLITSKI